MACDCLNAGLDDVFGERFARREARRFRKHGLPRRAQRVIEVVRPLVRFHEATLLEGGAGVGGISIELLRRGIRQAVVVDAIPAAIRTARQLAEEYGVAHRMSGMVADFAHMEDDTVHDLVVLDRVVCCYPDWRGLLDAAASRASRTIAFTYPRTAWWTRLASSAGNGILWMASALSHACTFPGSDARIPALARVRAPRCRPAWCVGDLRRTAPRRELIPPSPLEWSVSQRVGCGRRIDRNRIHPH